MRIRVQSSKKNTNLQAINDDDVGSISNPSRKILNEQIIPRRIPLASIHAMK